MPRDSGFADNSCSGPSRVPNCNNCNCSSQPSIKVGVESLSLHLHLISRRIFVGPTPANWNYKKKSILFAKSDHAKHHHNHYNHRKGKQRTFRATLESIGPSNTSSLDFRILEERRRQEVEQGGGQEEQNNRR